MLSKYSISLLRFLIIIVSSMAVTSASALVPQAQRDALVALHISTDGANWTTNTNWPVGDPCADDWYGIYCDSSDNIKWLQLVDNNLAGTIPPELANLSSLQRLHILSNQLTGTIPPELGNLANLEQLLFNNNQLSGTIPPELGNLSNLQRLYLSDNQLDGTIPPELANLSSLQRLYLDRNQLDGAIPPELGDLSNLQNLYLYDNQLSGPIPAELSKLSSLQSLRINGNQLNGVIPPELGNLVNLWMLALHENQLSGPIPPEFGKLVKLSILNLSNLQLNGQIPPELGKLTSLVYLDLGGNQLTGDIPVEFGNLLNLEALVLSSNQLSGFIPAAFADLSKLNTGPLTPGLDLHWNALYTTDVTLDAFLDSKSESDWSSTQTITPENIEISGVSGDSVSLAWNPIEYIDDTGRYRVLYSEQPGGPYTDGGVTGDKMTTGLTVTGLSPGTSYFFSMRSETDHHINNLNDVVSDYSVEIDVVTSFFSETSSFDADMDFLSDPPGGTLFTKVDSNNGFDSTQDATLVTLDANVTTPGALTLTSANATWQDTADDGVFLGTTIMGDFTAEMTVSGMDVSDGHSVGLMVRVPADENLDAAGPGQDWVSIGVTGDMTQVTTQNTDDGVTASAVETQSMVGIRSWAYDVTVTEVSFRLQRMGGIVRNGEVLQSGDVLRLEFRFGHQGEWIEATASPLIREDMKGHALEVGIYQTSINEATAIVDDFSIKDEQIFASGFE